MTGLCVRAIVPDILNVKRAEFELEAPKMVFRKQRFAHQRVESAELFHGTVAAFSRQDVTSLNNLAYPALCGIFSDRGVGAMKRYEEMS